jgi:deoxyribodipyrimidine photolyase-related protein
MSKRLLYIPFDHLNQSFGILKDADPKNDHVVLVESARMTTGRPWHKERLFFLISSARHFAKELELDGFQVSYVKSETTIAGLVQVRKDIGDFPIFAAEPSSFAQFNQLKDIGVQFIPNDFFLTSRVDFKIWADKQKSFLMETFYRAQRIRLNIMVQDGKPDTGVWNYDKDNRLPPPKNYTWPKYLEHERDQIDLEVCAWLILAPMRMQSRPTAGPFIIRY